MAPQTSAAKLQRPFKILGRGHPAVGDAAGDNWRFHTPGPRPILVGDATINHPAFGAPQLQISFHIYFSANWLAITKALDLNFALTFEGPLTAEHHIDDHSFRTEGEKGLRLEATASPKMPRYGGF